MMKMNMPKWERCNEKFDWFLESLFKGQSVSMNPYDYGDFLRYVKWSGLENEFKEMKKVDKKCTDENEPFPVYPEITLLDRVKKD